MVCAALAFAGAVVVAVLVGLVWRMSSRRQALPCPWWLGWMVELDNPLTRVNRAQFIVDHLGIHAGMRVLDAGCGPGRVTVPLARAVGPDGDVAALDVQEAMLSQARKKVEAAGLGNVRYLQGRLGQDALPSAEFDRAIVVSVLGEIPDRSAAMGDLYRALKPGGVLSITEVIFDPHFVSRSAVEQTAQAVGFVEKSFLGHRLAYTMHVEKPPGGRDSAARASSAGKIGVGRAGTAKAADRGPSACPSTAEDVEWARRCVPPVSAARRCPVDAV